MRRSQTLGLALAGLIAFVAGTAGADEPRVQPEGGRLNNLKVLSDKVDDVSSVEAIVRSFTKPGMSDQERSRALWNAIVKYRHQTIPPQEYLAGDWEVHDPVKVFNVYGYCMCCCTSALTAALNRADGRAVRGRILNGHSVPEVRYGDAWHMFDASLITFFPDPRTGLASSVDDIGGALASWYAGHAEYRKNPAKLVELMRRDDWMGWKENGPPLLADCPFYEKGYLPARTHGWDATMLEYDRKSEVYEYGYHVGHRAVFSLRPGESLVREAGNRGLHVNGDRMPKWNALKARAPEADLVYLKDFFPGYRGGIVGNGVHRYAPNLAAGDLALGAEVYDNLASGGAPALHVKEAGTPGIAIVPMVSPYVDLKGRVRVEAVTSSADDLVRLSISTNDGRTFTPLWSAPGVGVSKAEIDLSDHVLRRYAYWIKVEIASTAPRGAGLNRLELETDFQHAPRTLPWLGTGTNTITVAADGDAALATRTTACRITDETRPERLKNETIASMGVTVDNLNLQNNACWWTSGTGTMTVPIEVPGDLAALRFCAHVRARGKKDAVRMMVSTDAGSTWREAGRLSGPTPATTGAFRFDDLPAGTRKALLRFELTGNGTIGIFSFRVDADYRDPLAATVARPFQVVHRWAEGGREASHTETVRTLPTTYRIDAGAGTETTSVAYEMPASP